MIEQVIVIGGSDPKCWPDLSQFDPQKIAFIGVDRGSFYGLKKGLKLEQAVGDFDSLTEKEYQYVKGEVANVTRFPSEKDDTDMQLGLLAAIKEYPKANYMLIGATGGRLDHYLSNIWLPLQERFVPFISRIQLRDNQNTVTYFLPGDYTIEKEPDKDYLAFVCLTKVTQLTLMDAKYQLDKTDFEYPVSLSSNEFIGDISHFSFESGIVCIIQSKDIIKRG